MGKRRKVNSSLQQNDMNEWSRFKEALPSGCFMKPNIKGAELVRHHLTYKNRRLVNLTETI